MEIEIMFIDKEKLILILQMMYFWKVMQSGYEGKAAKNK